MRISKFFRTYSRVLLMIFMSLLLVVFLIGDVLQSWSRGMSGQNREIGSAFGQAVRYNDLSTVEANQKIWQGLGMMPQNLEALDAYLLVAEARQAGVRVGTEQVTKMLAQRELGPAIDMFRREQNRSAESIYQAIADWMAVMEYAGLQSEALGPSLPRLEQEYRNSSQEAMVKLSVIDARAFLDNVPEPTEEELLAAFEAGKNRPTTHTEEKLEFGYLEPNRVQLEYLTIDPNELRAQVRVREVEARRFYDENKARFTKQVPKATSQPVDPAQPPPMETVQLTWEEARQQAEEECRNAKAVEEAQRLVNAMHDEAAAAWRTMPVGEDGFRAAPPTERVVSFEALRDKYAASAPVVYKKTELVGQDKLNMEPGFGRAQISVGAERKTAPEMAMRVKGLYTPAKDERFPVLALLEPSPVMVRTQIDRFVRTMRPHQSYVFRVLAAAPSGPPASLDVVRDKVREDVKLAKAYAIAEGWARQLQERAQAEGLAIAIANFQELSNLIREASTPASQPASAPATPKPNYLGAYTATTPTGAFTRRARPLPNVGVSNSLHREVFAAAEAPPSATAPAHKVVLVPQASAQKWVLAEVLELKPVYQGDFDAQLEGQLQRARTMDYSTFRQNWFKPENIRARAQFARTDDRG